MIYFTFVSIAAKKKLQNRRDAMLRVSCLVFLQPTPFLFWFRFDAMLRVSSQSVSSRSVFVSTCRSRDARKEARGKRREERDARKETRGKRREERDAKHRVSTCQSRDARQETIHTNGKINAIVTPDLSSRLYK
jgi:hypothetical protein